MTRQPSPAQRAAGCDSGSLAKPLEGVAKVWALAVGAADSLSLCAGGRDCGVSRELDGICLEGDAVGGVEDEEREMMWEMELGMGFYYCARCEVR